MMEVYELKRRAFEEGLHAAGIYLSVRTLNCLFNDGFRSVEDVRKALQERAPYQWLLIPNFGRVSFSELKEAFGHAMPEADHYNGQKRLQCVVVIQRRADNRFYCKAPGNSRGAWASQMHVANVYSKDSARAMIRENWRDLMDNFRLVEVAPVGIEDLPVNA